MFGKWFHKNIWNLVSILILFVPDGGLEEKAKNLVFIPFSKIFSFPPLPNAWYFPHRVPRILIMKKKIKTAICHKQIQTWKDL